MNTQSPPENEELLRQLDAWDGSEEEARPLIRWSATHLRGCMAAERQRYIETVGQRAELNYRHFIEDAQ